MSYYRALGLEEEPFSTSPDPEYFFLSQEHDRALTNVLIELHLRRGLSVILGDVGTGKTTLSRKLVQCLRDRGDFIFHVVMDPYFKSERLFLTSLARNFNVDVARFTEQALTREPNALEMKEALQRFLYETCIVENKTVVLLIDEAQKLSPASLEMLRVILNYETNENKLLQLVLLGQMELHGKIIQIPNFFDRISFKYTLNPLGVRETRDMIDYRMRRAGYSRNVSFFLDDAVELIHETTRGYPRKVTMLCHKALKAVVMKNRWAVDEALIREIVEEDIRSGWKSQTLR